MPPKTPSELKEQIENQNETPAEPGKERTAEGMEVTPPSKEDFFGNLEKVARPDEGPPGD
jgi:hypothetical protein